MEQTATGYLDRILDPIGRCLTPEVARSLLQIKVDPEVQARVDELAEKCNEGVLTEQENREYHAYVNAGTFVAILKAKARRLLAESSSR